MSDAIDSTVKLRDHIRDEKGNERWRGSKDKVAVETERTAKKESEYLMAMCHSLTPVGHKRPKNARLKAIRGICM